MIGCEKSNVALAGKLRRSGARERILAVLASVSKPFTAAEILTLLSRKGARVNKTTVYREVETLKKAGLVREVFFRNDTALYELAGDHHHHLVCVSCGDVRDVRLKESFESEERRLERAERFSILEHSLEFFGMCEQCR